MNEILVGVDGTEAGDAALRWALAEAAVTSGHVTAMHAWQLHVYADPGGVYPFLTDSNETELQAQQLLERSLARVGQRVLASAGGTSSLLVMPLVLAGPAAQALEERARSASLLVLGRKHGSSAPFGSVTSAALHHVACPVVVVPSSYEPNVPVPSGRVVVGVAAGEASDGALRWAVAAASARGIPLVPVLVRSPAHGALFGAGWPDAASLDASSLAELARHARAGGADLSSVRPEVLVGDPGDELVRFAEPGDLLVVGSRGRGALSGWLLGSASNHVTRLARCPVVVVRDVS